VTAPSEVGFIGLGEMGGRLVRRLLARGYDVIAFDTRAEALSAVCELGADPAESAPQVADRTEVILLSLPTPDVVRAVTSEMVGSSAIRTCVDLSTTGPSVSRQIATELAAAGVELVDAPVSGGITGADNGTLTVMAAGPERALEEVRPILDELAGKLFHVGVEAGMGQLAKVLNNLLSATALAATAEALALGVKGGLDPQMLLDVFNASSGRNSATAQKFPQAVLPRTFDLGFTLALMNKDVQMCLEQGQRESVAMPVGDAVARRWAEAAEWAAAGADCTEIVKLVEAEAQTVIAARGAVTD
jgi:3-hydroxyisobutyrate dehydrogenase-like beta-hydroxyacid dehydrogenase